MDFSLRCVECNTIKPPENFEQYYGESGCPRCNGEMGLYDRANDSWYVLPSEVYGVKEYYDSLSSVLNKSDNFEELCNKLEEEGIDISFLVD